MQNPKVEASVDGRMNPNHSHSNRRRIARLIRNGNALSAFIDGLQLDSDERDLAEIVQKRWQKDRDKLQH